MERSGARNCTILQQYKNLADEKLEDIMSKLRSEEKLTAAECDRLSQPRIDLLFADLKKNGKRHLMADLLKVKINDPGQGLSPEHPEQPPHDLVGATGRLKLPSADFKSLAGTLASGRILSQP